MKHALLPSSESLSPTNQEILSQFESYLTTKGYRPHTIAGYCRHIRHFMEFLPNDLTAVQDGDVQAFQHILHAQGRIPSTIRHYGTTIRRCLTFLADEWNLHLSIKELTPRSQQRFDSLSQNNQELLTTFLERQGDTWTAETIRHFTATLQQFLVFLQKDLTDVQDGDLQAFEGFLQTKQLRPRTVSRKIQFKGL